MDELLEAIKVGKIIELYPDDTPTPSYLMLGFLEDGRPLHLVCSLGEVLWFIIAYWPSLEICKEDFETRREKS
ncbi:MAG: DUF4258 domain-containing protein [Eubacteriales bacterium]